MDGDERREQQRGLGLKKQRRSNRGPVCRSPDLSGRRWMNVEDPESVAGQMDAEHRMCHGPDSYRGRASLPPRPLGEGARGRGNSTKAIRQFQTKPCISLRA